MAQLVNTAGDFWAFLGVTTRLSDIQHLLTTRGIIVRRQHPELATTYRELKAVRQSINQQETREAQLKQVLQQAMGAATRAEFTEGYISWKKSKDSIGLDVEQMLKDKPYLQARYPKIKTGSRRFLIA